MTEGLIQHVGTMAEAQAASMQKIDRFAEGMIAVHEKLRVQVAAAQASEARIAEQQSRPSRTNRRLGDREPAQQAGRSSDAREREPLRRGEEHILHLQFAGPQLRTSMIGAEEPWRSKFGVAAKPLYIRAPRFHRYPSTKSESFDDAASPEVQNGCGRSEFWR